jgi:CheY-like chemotaxis protein
MLVKKPASQENTYEEKAAVKTTFEKPSLGPAVKSARTVIVAHGNPDITERMRSELTRTGYTVLISNDGIDLMVKISKEKPLVAVIDVALPKIFGFEVCKNLKKQPDTKDIKIILISAIYDKNRYRREPNSLYGADDYIEEHLIEDELSDKINALIGSRAGEKPLAAPQQEKTQGTGITGTVTEEPPRVEIPRVQAPAGKAPAADGVEKAKRLARTILADIYIYSSTKVDNSIKNGSFQTEFATELKEGLKLYEGRIPQDVKSKGDFFKETIENFINEKKNLLKI